MRCGAQLRSRMHLIDVAWWAGHHGGVQVRRGRRVRWMAAIGVACVVSSVACSDGSPGSDEGDGSPVEPIRVGGIVAVVDDDLWFTGGAVRSEQRWVADERVVVVNSAGAIERTFELPLDGDRWLSASRLSTFDGVSYLTGISCGESTGENPSCPGAAPVILRVDEGNLEALDVEDLPTAGSDLTWVEVMADRGGTLVITTETHSGAGPRRRVMSQRSPDGTFTVLPGGPVELPQGSCANADAAYVAGFFVTEDPDLVAASHRFGENTWSEPMRFRVGDQPGGLVDLRCVGDDVVLVHGRSVDTVTIRPLIVGGAPVDASPVPLPGPVTFAQPVEAGLILTVAAGPTTLEVWEYRTGGELRRVASHTGPTAGGAVVELDGGLYNLGRVDPMHLTEPFPLEPVTR